MPRPVPLHGRLEGTLTDFALWRRRALADGRIDEKEAMELVGRIVEPAVIDIRLLVKTQRHVNACLAGAEGMDSICASRSWEERQAERLWLGADEEDNEPDPPALAVAA